MNLYPKLLEYIKHCLAEFDLIPQKRKEELAVIGKYIRDCARKNEPAKLTFICTHNSRRSHLTQIWAQIAADYNGSGHVTTYSGGTEATAFNPRAVAALKRAGLTIEATGNPNNPHYQVNYSEKAEPLICYSKIYNAPENPPRGLSGHHDLYRRRRSLSNCIWRSGTSFTALYRSQDF